MRDGIIYKVMIVTKVTRANIIKEVAPTIAERNHGEFKKDESVLMKLYEVRGVILT